MTTTDYKERLREEFYEKFEHLDDFSNRTIRREEVFNFLISKLDTILSERLEEETHKARIENINFINQQIKRFGPLTNIEIGDKSVHLFHSTPTDVDKLDKE